MSVHVSRGVVRFSETDASGRHHYTAPQKWAENAEHEVIRAAGGDVAAFPRRVVNATYELPLNAGDEYVVELGVGRLGTTSISYEWRVLLRGEVAVTGSHTTVHLGRDGRPAPLPPPVRSTLENLCV